MPRVDFVSVFDFRDSYPLSRIKVMGRGLFVHVWTIIDTGSPYTMVPTSTLEELRLSEEDVITTVTIHGIVHKEGCSEDAPAYLLDLEIGGRRFKDVMILSYDFGPELGLIGHNVLRNFRLEIDWKEKHILLERV